MAFETFSVKEINWRRLVHLYKPRLFSICHYFGALVFHAKDLLSMNSTDKSSPGTGLAANFAFMSFAYMTFFLSVLIKRTKNAVSAKHG